MFRRQVLKAHPFAELFPLMEGAELAALAEDIKQHGQRAPASILDGMVLDGRNRVKACEMAGIEPKTRVFTGSDPLGFVLSANLHRRHLTESQRAMVAAKMATLSSGEHPKSSSANLPTSAPRTQGEAAKMLSVSPRLVREARTVLENPKLAKAVVNGTRTVHAAAKEIRKKQEAKEVRRDSTGYAIPEELWPLWDRRDEVQTILTAISKARGALRAVMEAQGEGEPDPLYFHANVSGAQAHLNNAWTSISMALPHATCPVCQGRAKGTCKLCKGSGFIPKHTYDHALSDELRAVREKSCEK